MDNPPPTPPPPYTPPGASNPGQPYLGQPSPGQQYPGQPPGKGWFGRNCLWFVPVGCLSLLALIALFGAGIVFFVFGAMKSSDPYKTAVSRAKSSVEAGDALGKPVEEAFYLSGSINGGGSSGTADLFIPVSGPKAKGTVHVVGVKSDGSWTYSTMNLHVDGTNENIDLLPNSP